MSTTAPFPSPELPLPQLQHTFGHINCPACISTRSDVMGRDPDSLARLQFTTAAVIWLETCKPYMKDNSFVMKAQHVKQLGKFFSELTPAEIHIGHLRHYQRARSTNEERKWKGPAQASIINHELSVMQQLLKRCGRWGDFREHYHPLPTPPSQKPKVMTQLEEYRLFKVAETNVDFELAYLVASLSVNTTACGSELRHLRLEHIAIDAGRFTVNPEQTKNQYRARTIPLNTTALEAMQRCLKRAQTLGSFMPEHYLFPKRLTRNRWNPYEPASTSWLRVSFNALRDAADLPWLTPHCLRHQSITTMLENGAPPEIVRAIAGHVSDQMMRHYCHTRFSASLDVLNKIDSRKRRA